jgi:hypothetical protein
LRAFLYTHSFSAPTSFQLEDLRAIYSQAYTTHQEAKIALGLFEDESEVLRAMRVAVAAYSHPGQLQYLYATCLWIYRPQQQSSGNLLKGAFANFALDNNGGEANSKPSLDINGAKE